MSNSENNRSRKETIGFDILRLVAMMMVTMLHITGHGLEGVAIRPFCGAYWITLILNTFSLPAVNCFVLISGYFLSRKDTSLKKVGKLWLQVWTYSVAVYLVLCVMPDANVHFNVSTLVECLFPLLSHQYWFFTCYLLLYLVAPILNKVIAAWQQQEYQRNLLMLIAVFCLLPSINIWGDPFGTKHGYSLLWFSVLYLIGGYVRNYRLELPVHPALFYAVPLALLCVFNAAIAAWSPGADSVYEILRNLNGYNSPFILCASIGMLIWTKDCTFRPGMQAVGIIQKAASLTFGVYLLQDHGMIRSVLWNDWVRLGETGDIGGAFFLRIITVLMILFVGGLAVEFVRGKLMDRLSYLLNRNN